LLVSVLPHLEQPQKAIDEAYRVLKPGGVFYVSAPFLNPFQKDPIDLVRFTCDGVAKLCARFERIDSGFNRGPASTMTELNVYFLALLFSFNSTILFRLNHYVFRWLFSWLKYMDVFLGQYKLAHLLHTGSFFVGRKPKA
jgi:SAM-dependent methyltransferase